MHGGIDGYSRVPVFLKARNNNRADSVLAAFESAVMKWGLPERVRSDKGGENVLVAEYMLRRRSIDSRPFITGKSVHNQRLVLIVICFIIFISRRTIARGGRYRNSFVRPSVRPSVHNHGCQFVGDGSQN